MSQTPKKIVSKGEYLRIRSVFGARMFALGSIGILMILSGFIAVGLLLCLPFMALSVLANGMNAATFGIVMLLDFSCAAITFRAYKGMDGILSAVESMPSIVPLTRANTADLPADTSLVRASEPPVTPQQDVLLRPVTETQDSHEEQLLRPS